MKEIEAHVFREAKKLNLHAEAKALCEKHGLAYVLILGINDREVSEIPAEQIEKTGKPAEALAAVEMNVGEAGSVNLIGKLTCLQQLLKQCKAEVNLALLEDILQVKLS